MTDLLPLLPDNTFERVLCVVAHPDDLEYGTSAVVAKWTDMGIEVAYLLLTKGEAGMPNPPAETAVIRRGEQTAACTTVGVTDLTMLDHPDGILMYSLDLRRDIALQIRRFRPDVVLTTNFDFEPPWGLNQADHRAAGLATVDAVRDAANPWIFPEQVADAILTPHQAKWILVAGANDPTHGVEVSAANVERGIASLKSHEQYLAALPWHPDPAEFIPPFATAEGAQIGVEYGCVFKAFDLGN
ncbi:MAG: PIG-L family deacetylase [Nocardiaceae bacterium]|nr:PIG-L family deacetylase [Nocardiaceae bacterium]